MESIRFFGTRNGRAGNASKCTQKMHPKKNAAIQVEVPGRNRGVGGQWVCATGATVWDSGPLHLENPLCLPHVHADWSRCQLCMQMSATDVQLCVDNWTRWILTGLPRPLAMVGPNPHDDPWRVPPKIQKPRNRKRGELQSGISKRRRVDLFFFGTRHFHLSLAHFYTIKNPPP